MKRKGLLSKRCLAGVLAALLICQAMPISAAAVETLSAGETVYGPEETIQVTGSDLSGRNINFNSGWKFNLGDNSSASEPNFNDSAWEEVMLPHDFSISQNFTTSGEAESGFLPGGTGWYRKSFTVPASESGNTVILNFDGVYSDAYVYVNGTYVGENHYGYSNFSFDISDYLTMDGVTENVIAVRAVNNVPTSRWYSGSGIYRDVTLDIVKPVHVADNGTFVTTPDIENNKGTVEVAVDVVNDSDSTAEVTITNTVVETNDSESTTQTVGAGATSTVTTSCKVLSPELWSIDDPNLYTVRTELSVNGEVVDTYDTTFGFRWYSFDSSGFHLNGEKVKLNGVCLHHDQGAAGAAAYDDAMYRQLSIMKDMGVNAIRTSHNPADEDFIDICNELGFVVIEELFDGWVEAKNTNYNDFSRYFEVNLTSGNNVQGGDSSMTWAEFVAKNVVKRDRNDPSIILWSLCNEVQEGTYWTDVGRYADIAQNLIDWIDEVDGTRPTTSGDNNRGGDSRLVAVLNTILDNGGVVGFNYANSAVSLYSLAQQFGGVIIASETSSATNSRGIYSSQINNNDADGELHLTSYDTSAVGWGITAHDSLYNTYQNDCIAGEFVWTGFDYIGEPTPWNGTGTGSVSYRGAIPNSSYFGIVDTAGFEKDTYYLYRSQWNKDETTLHLVTAWDSDNMYTTGGKTPVVIYSNAPVVKLYRNGDLIGTATRMDHTSDAGHTYYTYTTESNNSDVCTAVSASGADSLYATFNVTYEEGTISARAFEADGTMEISLSGNSGNQSVSTPGTVSRLAVTQDKTEIDADGQSLAYVEVEVQDAKGNLDTTATNTINFSLSGDGEIVGVDNGDQATTEKYQQSSVLTSDTAAHIAAYAGKALVIVRSTEQAGSFTVDVSSSGLSGGSVTVTTEEVGDGTADEGLVSYTMVRDYTVKVGTRPALKTDAKGTMADGSSETGTISWNDIGEEVYNTPGDHTLNGTLQFKGQEPIAVTARLHVIADVVALQNISTATTPGTAPALPSVVSGVQADGTLSGQFTVDWDEVSADKYAEVGDIVTVNGTAAIFGTETLPVTCTVRVAEEVSTESTNVAPQVLSLTQDIAAENQSDNLNAVNNEYKEFVDNTSERWSNWNNRTNSATATLTFTWATAQVLGGVNLYYYYDNCAAEPESVEFQYSLNGSEYYTIDYISELVQEAGNGLGAQFRYTFDSVINPVALRIVFTQQDGTSGAHCVAVIEAEIMTYAGELEYNDSAQLSSITVDGVPIAGFAAETLEYTASGSAVAATTDQNAGITVLPALDNVVRILTISEDGSEALVYTVTLDNIVEDCKHENTEIRNQKDATCTEDGYTGDTYCADCGKLLQTGTSIPATGHAWDAGVVTKQPTATEEGIRTYTCQVCGVTKEEPIPMISSGDKIPSVSISAEAASNGRIRLVGQFENYENISDYYRVTSHGLLYLSSEKLGIRTLSLSTAGRTRVFFAGYNPDGTFSYTMTPANTGTMFTMRAYLTYVDNEGNSVTVYSEPCIASYDSL